MGLLALLLSTSLGATSAALPLDARDAAALPALSYALPAESTVVAPAAAPGVSGKYFGARYYGSKIGRFTTVDPYLDTSAARQSQRWNRYAYGLNNPLRNVDPDGRDSLDLAIGFGQGVGRVAVGAATAFGTAIDRHGIPNPGAAAMMGYEVSQNVQALGYAASNPGAVVDAYVALSTSPNGADQRLLGARMERVQQWPLLRSRHSPRAARGPTTAFLMEPVSDQVTRSRKHRRRRSTKPPGCGMEVP
jgi:RHS repeat-associated protein